LALAQTAQTIGFKRKLTRLHVRSLDRAKPDQRDRGSPQRGVPRHAFDVLIELVDIPLGGVVDRYGWPRRPVTLSPLSATGNGAGTYTTIVKRKGTVGSASRAIVANVHQTS
jgi:hypothetical protein